MKQQDLYAYIDVCNSLEEAASEALYNATITGCDADTDRMTAEEFKHRIIRNTLLDARAKIIRLLSHEERSNPAIHPDNYEASYLLIGYDPTETFYQAYDRKHAKVGTLS